MSQVVILRFPGYNDARIVQLHDQFIERLRAVPGVTSVTSSYLPPVRTNPNILRGIRVSGRGLQTYNGWVDGETVGPGYFKTLGVPIIRGRDFGPSDHSTAPKVAIINETLARQSFPNTDPVGKHFRGGNREDIEIIGVVQDVKHEIRSAAPALYQLISQNGPPLACYFNIRTTGDLMPVASAIRQAMRGIDSNLPVTDVMTIDATIEDGLASEFILARASSFFAGTALALAAIGLFGVMSFSVTRRTGEIGIRIALGAPRANVAWLVMRETLVLTLIGSLVGLAASLTVTNLLTSMLFGLEPTSPAAMSAAVLLMVVVALFAGYLPARRASRIDPMIALRHE